MVFIETNFDLFDYSKLDLQIQSVSNDDYLLCKFLSHESLVRINNNEIIIHDASRGRINSTIVNIGALQMLFYSLQRNRLQHMLGSQLQRRPQLQRRSAGTGPFF